MKHTRFYTLCMAAIGLSVPITGHSQSALEEIIVTATKREQTLQDIPVAVTVTTGETIEKAAIQDIKDLQSVVPTLRVSQLQNSSNTNFSIRGFGNGANNAGIEPSVGVFIDGVYRSRSVAQIADLPNVTRVEVLSGPQNTLFGKNASAGAISIITREPDGTSAGKVGLTLGNFSQVVAKAQLEGAVTDNLAFDISGSYNTRDGYIRNENTGTDINERNRYDIRGQLVWLPNDDMKIRVIADYSEIDEVCCGALNLFDGPTGNAIRAIGGQFVPNDSEALRGFFSEDAFEEIEAKGISGQLDWDFDNFTFTSITSYRETDRISNVDADFTSADLVTNDFDVDFETFTQEFRLTSSGGGDVDWMLGAFFFDESISQSDRLIQTSDTRAYFDAFTGLLGAPGALAGIESALGLPVGNFFFNEEVRELSTLDNTSYSLFGTVDWHFTESTTLTLGLNYTKDEKDATVTQLEASRFSSVDLAQLGFGSAFGTITGLPPTPENIAANPGAAAAAQAAANNPATNPLLGLRALQFTPPILDIPNAFEDGSTDDDEVTYTVRLAHNINDAVNVYANYSTGFKASSWNLSRQSRPTPATIAQLQAAGAALPPNLAPGVRFADPEEATLYELGLKAKFDRWSVNLAVFDQEIEGFQSNVFLGGGFNLINAGSQSTQGVEFDIVYYPTDNLKLGLTGLFLDPEYDDFANAAVPVGSSFDAVPTSLSSSPTDGVGSLTGQTPSGIHETSLSFNVNYSFNIGDMEAYVGGDYQYDDNIQVIDNVSPEIASREVKNLNLSAGIRTNNGLGVSIWGRNVTDHVTLISAFPATAQAGSFNGYRTQPRTYGVTVTKEF